MFCTFFLRKHLSVSPTILKLMYGNSAGKWPGKLTTLKFITFSLALVWHKMSSAVNMKVISSICWWFTVWHGAKGGTHACLCSGLPVACAPLIHSCTIWDSCLISCWTWKALRDERNPMSLVGRWNGSALKDGNVAGKKEIILSRWNEHVRMREIFVICTRATGSK